ncbi:MAG: c-type cytochrome [candidate division Zixibacteria bacterium]|nr:c-type cytochrome [candidate division Zixibacteria bacterium]
MLTQRISTLLFGMAVCIAVPLAGRVSAQIPQQFTNLKTLPKDIKRADLIQFMRGYATDLGVRCNHCHVGENPASLDGYDFASDAKEPKRTARVMIAMTQAINTTYLPETGRKPLAEVKCATCHHGAVRPQHLGVRSEPAP